MKRLIPLNLMMILVQQKLLKQLNQHHPRRSQIRIYRVSLVKVLLLRKQKPLKVKSSLKLKPMNPQKIKLNLILPVMTKIPVTVKQVVVMKAQRMILLKAHPKAANLKKRTMMKNKVTRIRKKLLKVTATAETTRKANRLPWLKVNHLKSLMVKATPTWVKLPRMG